MTDEAPAPLEPAEAAPVEAAAPPPPAVPPEPLQPVAPMERVATIDILRGLALFGILAANIRGFAGPAVSYFAHAALFWPALNDRIAQAFVDTFIQGKFITIFAFLFGAGFAVQLERAQGRKFGGTYARRLTILALFGMIHGLLIWFGDILLAYAVIGFMLLLFRKRKDKTVAVWSAIGLLFFPIIVLLVFIASMFGTAPDAGPRPTAAELAQLSAIFEHGSWSEIQQQRTADVFQYNWSLIPMMLPQILGLFLAGVYAWRKRFFTPAPESLPKYRRAMILGLTIGIGLNVMATYLRAVLDAPMMPKNVFGLAYALGYFLGTPALSLGYICAVILLCQSERVREKLRAFGAIGRTALSNYLLQSIIGTLIFYNYGLGLFGKLGPAWLLPLTVVIYLLQAFLSSWWMARHRYGPMEWLWRRLTYGRAMDQPREVVVAQQAVTS